MSAANKRHEGKWVFFPFPLRRACLSVTAWAAGHVAKGHPMDSGVGLGSKACASWSSKHFLEPSEVKSLASLKSYPISVGVGHSAKLIIPVCVATTHNGVHGELLTLLVKGWEGASILMLHGRRL